MSRSFWVRGLVRRVVLYPAPEQFHEKFSKTRDHDMILNLVAFVETVSRYASLGKSDQ